MGSGKRIWLEYRNLRYVCAGVTSFEPVTQDIIGFLGDTSMFSYTDFGIHAVPYIHRRALGTDGVSLHRASRACRNSCDFYELIAPVCDRFGFAHNTNEKHGRTCHFIHGWVVDHKINVLVCRRKHRFRNPRDVACVRHYRDKRRVM